MILYLHGFRSSPRSTKARLLAERMEALGLSGDYVCPQLPASPKAAMELALSLVAACPAEQLTIVGSSLGGYYATWLAERLGCRAVLLNPAVGPLTQLEQYVGISTEYGSQKPFEFKREYLDQLRALAVAGITRPQRYFLIAASGDEVLDHRRMLSHYAGARQHVIDGGDHAISDFAPFIAPVLAFCGVADGAA